MMPPDLLRRCSRLSCRAAGGMYGRLLGGLGANLRELMERMGHSSTRAAMIYLHSTSERQRALADTLNALVATRLKSERTYTKASGTGVARHGANDA